MVGNKICEKLNCYIISYLILACKDKVNVNKWTDFTLFRTGPIEDNENILIKSLLYKSLDLRECLSYYWPIFFTFVFRLLSCLGY